VHARRDATARAHAKPCRSRAPRRSPSSRPPDSLAATSFLATTSSIDRPTSHLQRTTQNATCDRRRCRAPTRPPPQCSSLPPRNRSSAKPSRRGQSLPRSASLPSLAPLVRPRHTAPTRSRCHYTPWSAATQSSRDAIHRPRATLRTATRSPSRCRSIHRAASKPAPLAQDSIAELCTRTPHFQPRSAPRASRPARAKLSSSRSAHPYKPQSSAAILAYSPAVARSRPTRSHPCRYRRAHAHRPCLRACSP
jgi:hypothetical protein